MKKFFLLLILFPFILDASTKLIVLGSGTPNPDPERKGSAYAVIVNDKAYLVLDQVLLEVLQLSLQNGEEISRHCQLKTLNMLF